MLAVVDGGSNDFTPPTGTRIIVSSKPLPRPVPPRRPHWQWSYPIPVRAVIPAVLVLLLACCGGVLENDLPTVPTLSPLGPTIGPPLYTHPPTTATTVVVAP